MSMTVDFHSHILPKMDDGSRSVEESHAMLQLLGSQGIREVVLTPHFYPQHTTPRRFLEKRSRCEGILREYIAGEEGLPKLRCGAEVYFYPQMSHSDDLRDLAIQGTDCHNMTNRKPNLGPAAEVIARKLGKDALRWIRANERRVLG